jgi:hypothetical protein
MNGLWDFSPHKCPVAMARRADLVVVPGASHRTYVQGTGSRR